MSSFADLPLTEPVLKSLERMNYVTPTDVQVRTIPLVLEGRDVLVTAQTGTGKTAAFAVPVLERMIAALEADEPVKRTLILAPTRELAEQIGTVLRELTFFFRRLRYTVVIGGAPYPKQFRELNQNPAFVVGTPGRLIDHIETGTLKLDDFDTLILDEADRMLDMGFAPQIEMIVSKFPGVRQTMMFSATLPNEVRALVARYLKSPARVAIGEENRPVAAIKQDVIQVNEGEKEKVLLREIDKLAGSLIVFTKTRLRADLVAHSLNEAGHKVAALHGDLTQRERRRVTQAFRDGGIRILVATDIAARGLDIDHVRHVFNFDLPMVPEDYVHRIGRTGRAGAEGHAVAFVTPQEKHRWNQILRVMGAGGQPSGRSVQRGYKNASSKGAFSGAEPASDRRNPFASAYNGPSERELREQGPRKPGPKISYLSAEGKKVREDFQSRVEKAENRQAKRLGRNPRFTPQSNARLRGEGGSGGRAGGRSGGGGAGLGLGGGRSGADSGFSGGARGGVSAGGAKKPHKGAPDTRARKSNARSPKPSGFGGVSRDGGGSSGSRFDREGSSSFGGGSRGGGARSARSEGSPSGRGSSRGESELFGARGGPGEARTTGGRSGSSRSGFGGVSRGNSDGASGGGRGGSRSGGSRGGGRSDGSSRTGGSSRGGARSGGASRGGGSGSRGKQR